MKVNLYIYIKCEIKLSNHVYLSYILQVNNFELSIIIFDEFYQSAILNANVINHTDLLWMVRIKNMIMVSQDVQNLVSYISAC